MRALFRRWRRKRHICMGLVLALVLFGYVYAYPVIKEVLRDMNCSDIESQTVIAQYCQSYREKVIVGDLCPSLCDLDYIEYDKCTNYHAGKRVIFVNCHGYCQRGKMVRAVLKTHHKNLSDSADAFFAATIAEEEGQQQSMQHLRDFVRNSIVFDLRGNLSSTEDELRFMWQENYRSFLATKESRKAMALTVMSLVQQPEYQFAKFMQREKFIPKIYGSCGPLYLVEFTPPGDILDTLQGLQFWKTSHAPWRERADLALKLLRLIRVLNSMKPEPLHLCDVKGENFGIGQDDKEIKLIDTDTVFMESRLTDEFKNTKCKSNDQCNFFDCRGYCDVANGRCLPLRTNNNLQTLCEKIFARHLLPGMGVALLGEAPPSISAEVQDTVMECAFGSRLLRGIKVQHPDSAIFQKLQLLLERREDQLLVDLKRRWKERHTAEDP